MPLRVGVCQGKTEGAAYLGPSLQKIGRNPLALDEAVRVLLSYSLIHRDPHTANLSIHPLVQTVLTSVLSVKARKQWQKRVVRVLAAVFPEEPIYVCEKCERLLSHVLVMMPYIEHEEELELFYPAIVRAILQTGYRGYLAHEFLPKGETIAALRAAFELCNLDDQIPE